MEQATRSQGKRTMKATVEAKAWVVGAAVTLISSLALATVVALSVSSRWQAGMTRTPIEVLILVGMVLLVAALVIGGPRLAVLSFARSMVVAHEAAAAPSERSDGVTDGGRAINEGGPAHREVDGRAEQEGP